MESARPHDASRNRLENSRPRSNPGAIPYSQMIDDSNTSTEHDILTDSSASGYSRLGGDNRIFTDNHIVRDLDQVVDFDTLTNEGSSEGSAVYCGVGTYLHVVLQFNDSHLWNFNAPLRRATPLGFRADTRRAQRRSGAAHNLVQPELALL